MWTDFAVLILYVNDELIFILLRYYNSLNVDVVSHAYCIVLQLLTIVVAAHLVNMDHAAVQMFLAVVLVTVRRQHMQRTVTALCSDSVC